MGYGDDTGRATSEYFLLVPIDNASAGGDVLGTDTIDKTAFAAVNSNATVKSTPMIGVTAESAEDCSAFNLLTQNVWGNEHNGCLDAVLQACSVWYFHQAPDTGFRNCVTYGDRVNVRNACSALRPTPFYPGGGRNLTMAAGSSGHDVKTSGGNHDNDDKSKWVVQPWDGNVWNGSTIPRRRLFTGTDPELIKRLMNQKDIRSFFAKAYDFITGRTWSKESWLTQIEVELGVAVVAVGLGAAVGYEVVGPALGGVGEALGDEIKHEIEG